jgi:hypothetical protein
MQNKLSATGDYILFLWLSSSHKQDKTTRQNESIDRGGIDVGHAVVNRDSNHPLSANSKSVTLPPQTLK